MFGRQLLSNHIIFPTRVSFDGSPRYKAGGVSLDLTTVAAASVTDTTLPDTSVIKAGSQFLRYGQVLCKITAPATDVVTINASGGTFTLTVNNSGGLATTSALAFGATAATVQTAVVALANVGTSNATVSGSAGGPFTVTFANSLGATILTASGASLTGGLSTATIVANAPGGNVGFFGPYDPAATDGRQTLTRGECFVLDETKALSQGGTLPAANNIFGGVIDGGSIWIGRALQSGVASHTLAAGPTLSEFLAAFPEFALVKD